ncbi:hypothetical protein C3L29_036795, partial [Pseudomonas sp. MWU12-2534b]
MNKAYTPLIVPLAFLLLLTAYAWFGWTMTSCDGVEFCASGFAHAAYAAGAYGLTAASTVALIRVVYL